MARYYLEVREGTSSKGYALVHIAETGESESVAFAFGRIGHLRDWDYKVRGVSPVEAAKTVESLLGEKRRKGYADVPWPVDLAPPVVGTAAELPFISYAAGVVPGEGAPVIAGIALPHGRLQEPGLPDEDDAVATLWLTDDPVPDAPLVWARLADAFPQTGLWPLIVAAENLDDVLTGRGKPSRRSVRPILESSWDENVGTDGDDVEDESGVPAKFPGLAPATVGRLDRSAYAAAARGMTGRIGLVAVERPADTVREVGWQGWANYGFSSTDMAVVYRSWEERFGAVLIGLEFDVLQFGVARPPRTLEAASAIANECFATCPDIVWQGLETMSALAADLVNRGVWWFWWD